MSYVYALFIDRLRFHSARTVEPQWCCITLHVYHGAGPVYWLTWSLIPRPEELIRKFLVPLLFVYLDVSFSAVFFRHRYSQLWPCSEYSPFSHLHVIQRASFAVSPVIKISRDLPVDSQRCWFPIIPMLKYFIYILSFSSYPFYEIGNWTGRSL